MFTHLQLEVMVSGTTMPDTLNPRQYSKAWPIEHKGKCDMGVSRAVPVECVQGHQAGY